MQSHVIYYKMGIETVPDDICNAVNNIEGNANNQLKNWQNMEIWQFCNQE